MKKETEKVRLAQIRKTLESADYALSDLKEISEEVEQVVNGNGRYHLVSVPNVLDKLDILPKGKRRSVYRALNELENVNYRFYRAIEEAECWVENQRLAKGSPINPRR